MLDPQKLKEDLVLVYRSVDETAAAVAQSLLEEAGIPCSTRSSPSISSSADTRRSPTALRIENRINIVAKAQTQMMAVDLTCTMI